MNHQAQMMTGEIKLSTRKIEEPKQKEVKVCFSREHNVPMFQVFQNGLYEHTCPECGSITQFRVANPTF